MRPCARADYAKIVRSRDAQCNAKELPKIKLSFPSVFKGEGHFKNLLFCLRLQEVVIQLFHLQRLRRPPFWNCPGSHAVFMKRHPVRLEIDDHKKNLASFTSLAKSTFSQPIIYFFIINAIPLAFGACLAQNNMAQEQPS